MITQAEISFDFQPPLGVARQIMREYADSLQVDLRFQNFERELADLPGHYAEPKGCLIVASLNAAPAGCGAFRALSDSICEMKRLYVKPEFRGHSIGREIAMLLIAKASNAGYQAMRLDSLPFMSAAIQLYRSLGFYEIAPYYESPIPGTAFLEAKLSMHKLHNERM